MSLATTSVSQVEQPERVVLVVEDEPALRSSMVRGLSRVAGIAAIGAADVRSAREAVLAHEPSLVVSDLDLPDGSGLDVALALDGVGLRVPLIFVTAYLSQYAQLIPHRKGIDVFEKPVALERLRQLVEDRLAIEHALDESPFGVTDYLQLAGMARRSCVIDVRRAVTSGQVTLGTIWVRSGDIVAASDVIGDSMQALRRLAFVSAVSVTCRALSPEDVPEQQLEGSCEAILLELARQQDEMTDARVDPYANITLPESVGKRMTPGSSGTYVTPVASVDDGWPSPSDPGVSEAAAKGAALAARTFQKAYEAAVEALLEKNYADAYVAFARAAEVSPEDTRVRANLERLREMGYGQ